MDELVRRLRASADAWTAACRPEALELKQASDALTTLTAALAEVTEVLELRCREGETAADGGFGGGRITRALAAARAALREVGRG